MSSSLDDYHSTSGNSRANEILEDEMKAEYYLCINQPEEYRKKVDAISDLLSEQDITRLISIHQKYHRTGKDYN
jgi:hypothetical protein